MSKIYTEDKAKIAANRASAGERRIWNNRVENEKAARADDNCRAFMPRKASHKQGYKLG